MIIRIVILVSVLLAPIRFLAQQGAGTPKDSNAVAAEELEAIILETEKLDNKKAFVNIRARVAMLVSFSDSPRSEKMFLALWKFINERTDETFDREEAKLLVLKHLFSRNPKLARQLLSEQAKRENPSSPSRAMGGDANQRLATKLAAELVEMDPSAAAELLERSLSMGATPAGVGALSRLRELDSFLSDYVAARVLDGLTSQPTMVSLPGLHLMGAYVFPGAEAPIASPDAEASLQLLQHRYFLACYDVLRASLSETAEALMRGQRFNERDLQFRAAYQAQLAAILAALAPRLQPLLASELTDIASRLAPNVPANMPQLSRFTLARIGGNQLTSDDPETNFMSAISNGDLDDASKLLDRLKDGDKKDAYTQLLLKMQARALLAKSDVMGALTAIRKIKDPTTRLVSYLDALKATRKKRDTNLANIVINEARLLIPQTARNGLHLRALLSFATQMANGDTKADALEFLNSAVVTINALERRSTEKGEAQNMAEAAMAELNDPLSLLDAEEMEQAFSAVGMMDLEGGLALARLIELKPVQLVARLETIQGIIKRGAIKPKSPAKPAKSSPNSKS